MIYLFFCLYTIFTKNTSPWSTEDLSVKNSKHFQIIKTGPTRRSPRNQEWLTPWCQAQVFPNLSRSLRVRMELSQYLRWDHLIIASYPVCWFSNHEAPSQSLKLQITKGLKLMLIFNTGSAYKRQRQKEETKNWSSLEEVWRKTKRTIWCQTSWGQRAQSRQGEAGSWHFSQSFWSHEHRPKERAFTVPCISETGGVISQNKL